MVTSRSIASMAGEWVASLIAPPRCAACDESVPLLTAFCSACASTIERAARARGDSFAAFVYGGAVARAITRFKYERRPDLARPLADLLWRALEPHAPALRGAVVVPVPLHPSRLAERGFNQSSLVARRVAQRLGAVVLPLALERVRDTPRQAALDRGARIANVNGAFRARQPQRLVRKTVLLIDDVCTTGATIDACQRALVDGGASCVARAYIAHVRPDEPQSRAE
jgi:ComF family protein